MEGLQLQSNQTIFDISVHNFWLITTPHCLIYKTQRLDSLCAQEMQMNFSTAIIAVAVMVVGVIKEVDSRDVRACKDNTCSNIPALG